MADLPSYSPTALYEERAFIVVLVDAGNCEIESRTVTAQDFAEAQALGIMHAKANGVDMEEVAKIYVELVV